MDKRIGCAEDFDGFGKRSLLAHSRRIIDNTFMSDLGDLMSVPHLKEVRSFANHLHSTGKHWQGEIFGWQAEYTPESDRKPEDSRMTFTPADFWIGESGIWFFSLMWEHGKDQEPVAFLDDRGIIK